ncbi:MAG: hypothetical protein EBS56_00575 [Planctomycetia bacterium]|nr:hypothetical protein [Planctomycetia bacterium]
MFQIGMILVASGLLHAAIWAVTGGPWEGPVTWRKPILFGISGGLTALSMGWAWAQLPQRWADRWLAAATAWALLVEVALIDLQAWRGVASHFNRSTPLDSFLYDAMGGLILFVTLVAIDLTVRFFRQRTALPADMLLAARAGLVFLVWSCLLGIWVSVNGDIRVAEGLSPETFGRAGVTKFPHGAVIHALQWLPLLAWAARRAGLSEPVRLRLVTVATLGTAIVGGYALVQTLMGRSRFDVTLGTEALFAVGAACLGLPAVIAGWAWLRQAQMTDASVR